MISTNALYLAHKGGEIWTLLTMDIGIEIKHGHSPHVHFSLSLDCLMWWMRVCLSLYNLMICPYLGCVTEAGKWRIGWGAHSGVGMRGQWRLSLQSWSWSSVLGSGPALSHRFGWNFHWELKETESAEPAEARRGQAEPATRAATPGSGQKSDCAQLWAASAGLCRLSWLMPGLQDS